MSAVPSLRPERAAGRRHRASIEIVIPVYNEAAILERSVRRLHRFLASEVPFAWRVVIADNASPDGTWEIARRLAARLPGVRAMHLNQKGRGRALCAAWLLSRADVLCYMDVDLSTDLRALLPLLAGLISGHSEVATGTRLLPQITDQGWFFDTELLVLAQRQHLRIHEVAVDWTEDPDSRVDIVATALADLRGMARLWLHPLRDRLARRHPQVVARPPYVARSPLPRAANAERRLPAKLAHPYVADA